MLDTLGQYKLLDRIGAGRLGELCRARDTRHGRTVAIRLVGRSIAEDSALVQRLRAATVLSHPNIVTIYEIGEERGQFFVLSEFVPGETLARAIAGRPLHPRRALDLAAQIADGLADAHAEGIVHGAIRPEAVIVTPKGAAKVLDFGLAMAAAVSTSTPYDSPERAAGADIDERTDVFSLGAMLFEMLTGGPPFAGPSNAPGDRIQTPSPSALNRSLPREVDPIVTRAMARDAASRYETAATLAADLRAIGAILDVRNEAAEGFTARPQASRSPVLRSVALVVLAAVLVTALWVLFSRAR